MADPGMLSPSDRVEAARNFGTDDEENHSRSSADVSFNANAANVAHGNKHRRNRRKRMDATNTSQEVTQFHSEVINDDTPTGRPSMAHQNKSLPVPSEASQRPRRKKKKKILVPDTVDETQGFPMDSIQTDILLLKQNIISMPDDPKVLEDLTAKRQVWHTNVQSQPSDKVFIERQGGFKAMEKWKFTQKLASNLSKVQDGNAMMASKSGFASSRALRLGLSLHCCTKRLANYCHGILAGFALCQCVMVYHLSSSPFTLLDFIEHYSSVAFPVQAFFYAFSAICLVSVMGRCDEGNCGSSQWFQQIRNNGAGFIALLAYLTTVLLSLNMVDLDDKLALHGYNATMVTIEDAEMQTWMNVNLCRCLGAMFAWLVLAISTDRDLLYDNVKILIAEEEEGSNESN